MADIPSNLKFLESHEWARAEEDGSVTVGISDHAQELLGDIVFVELPEVGDEVDAGEDCAVAESVKAASDIYAPIGGEVIAINDEAPPDNNCKKTICEAPPKIINEVA